MREFLTNTMKLPRSKQPKIIGLTGHISEHFTREGLNAGMDDVVAKPIYVNKMEELLKSFGFELKNTKQSKERT